LREKNFDFFLRAYFRESLSR